MLDTCLWNRDFLSLFAYPFCSFARSLFSRSGKSHTVGIAKLACVMNYFERVTTKSQFGTGKRNQDAATTHSPVLFSALAEAYYSGILPLLNDSANGCHHLPATKLGSRSAVGHVRF